MTLYNYVVYEPSTGYVIVKGSGELQSVDPADFSTTAALLTYSDDLGDDLYVADGQALAKQSFAFQKDKLQIIADGLDVLTISNVPVNTTVTRWDGQQDVVNDGIVEFDTDLPGLYTLVFSAVPYLSEEVTIEAVAAT